MTTSAPASSAFSSLFSVENKKRFSELPVQEKAAENPKVEKEANTGAQKKKIEKNKSEDDMTIFVGNVPSPNSFLFMML